MALIAIFLIVFIIASISILFVDIKKKGIVTLAAVVINAILSSYVAIDVLLGSPFEQLFSGTLAFGAIPVKVDALSAWFILTINFTLITGILYGRQYLKAYATQSSTAVFNLHYIAFVLVQVSLIGVCAVQNAMAFLLFWELVALSAFVMVIFEYHKKETIRAGLNYLIQSHISIVFLMLAFMFVAYKTGSYDFNSITEFSIQQPVIAGTVLFICFFIGFAFKAGFVPFHTWLPYAHPAAPSHVSGVMSGIIIKIGIYGILRMLLLIHADYVAVGVFILAISLISGLYGVMLAIIQHNLKRLLAYHSIENIGIIGIGIGVGCIGLGNNNILVAMLGFTGALLHTLNHSLFKSLLFFSAGNIYQSTHTMDIERLGGIAKKMPQTTLLFLISALAICGLPPFNGFISEFLIYFGLYHNLYSSNIVYLIVTILSITSLVLVGGLALMCFTKAFSVVCLGNMRHGDSSKVQERSFAQLLPMYLAAALIVVIGLFPTAFFRVLQQPVQLFTQQLPNSANVEMPTEMLASLQHLSWAAFGLIIMVLAIYGLKKWTTRKKEITMKETWGCGFPVASSKIQYTANSFVRTYAKVVKPVLDIEKNEGEISETFPTESNYHTTIYDKAERYLIDKPIKLIKIITGWFTFLQNGNIQVYIIYGIVFISAIICVPYLFNWITVFLNFINHL
jgi:formate hydrogenlyase subunit 3/multisubunit Na+/H+ antiporter MnhD subunit